MAVPQHIIFNDGGTISIDVLDRPTTARVWVLDDTGASLVSNAAATISTISTTLNAAVAAGATTITVNNATGISSGASFWIRNPDEKVTCKTISGTVVTTWQPVFFAHAVSQTCESTLISYAVAAGSANRLFFDGRIQWELDGVNEYGAIECTKYPLKRRATLEDVRTIEPMISDLLEVESNTEAMLDAAHEDILGKVGSHGRIRVFTAGPEFIRATALQFLTNYFAVQTSERAQILYERYSKWVEDELSRVFATVPRDDDQDGYSNEPHERVGYRSIDLVR